MSAQSLQPTKALSVIEFSDADIPFPSGVATGNPSSLSLNQLIDTSVNFEALNFKVNDVVYNVTDNTAAMITEISGDTLTLNADIFVSTSDVYKVFPSGQNQGCLIHISTPTASDVIRCDIKTAAGDIIEGIRLSQGYHPIQLLNIYNTVSTSGDPVKIVAFW